MYEINWSEAIYSHFVILGKQDYLNDYTDRMELTSNVIETLVKRYDCNPVKLYLIINRLFLFSFQMEQQITKRMEQAIFKVVEMIQSVTLKYKMASLLGFKKIIASLINEQSLYYLKDTDYGRINL